MSPRSYHLAAYALTGFANFSSVGIQLGGIGAMAPTRRHDLARLGMKALFVGFVATLLERLDRWAVLRSVAVNDCHFLVEARRETVARSIPFARRLLGASRSRVDCWQALSQQAAANIRRWLTEPAYEPFLPRIGRPY